MKPIRLPSPPEPLPIPAAVKAKSAMVSTGEVDSVSVEPDLPWQQFINHLAACGWKPIDRRTPYPIHSFVFANESVGWHEDHGMGKAALWLLKDDSNVFLYSQLITKHGPIDMGEGNLVIFNADNGHAWISYGRCIFASVTVTPIRNRKQ